VGCVIGMIPLLLFSNDHAKDEEKDSRQLEKEIHQWKEKHADVLKTLERAKYNGNRNDYKST
jgi:hypothetical protein